MSDKEVKIVFPETEIPLETVLNPGMIVFKNEGSPLFKQPTETSPSPEESQIF
jgi:hypothetical protein